MLRIERLMKRNLVSVRSDETALGVSLLMRVLNVGSVFVQEQGDIIGIVTETDIEDLLHIGDLIGGSDPRGASPSSARRQIHSPSL